MPHARRVAVFLGACLVALALPAIAAGQQPPVPGRNPVGPGQLPPEQGSPIVSRVETGSVVGGDLKFATVGGQQALFLGGSGGYLFDGRFLVGGALYARVDRAYRVEGSGCHDASVVSVCANGSEIKSGDVYGGLLLGWRALRTRAVTVGVGGLFGLGAVTMGWDGAQSVVNPNVPGPGSHSSADVYELYDQGYFIFEPQVDVAVSLGPRVVLAGGLGYRMIGYTSGLNDQLKGLAVSLSVRVHQF
jgi:hypothetical protein